jgi:hypothetical protein
MATQITNKKDFINMLKKSIADDDVILMSQDLTGNLQVKKKLNQKQMTFAFAASSFNKSETVGDIVLGKVPVAAFAVCKQEDVSDDTLKKFHNKKK